jgi:hypothetical protein
MALSFEDALKQPGPLLAAWSLLPSDGKHWVIVFSLATGGAHGLAVQGVTEAERPALTAELERRGIRIGEYDTGAFVWSSSKERFTAWDDECCCVDAHDGVVHLADGRKLERKQISAVVAWAEDYVYRCVRLELTDGTTLDVVKEFCYSSEYTQYSRNELLFETTWAGVIARKLADWIGCAYRDEI